MTHRGCRKENAVALYIFSLIRLQTTLQYWSGKILFLIPDNILACNVFSSLGRRQICGRLKPGFGFLSRRLN